MARLRPLLLVVKIFLFLACDEILAYRARVSEGRPVREPSIVREPVDAGDASEKAFCLSVVGGGEAEGLQGGVVVASVVYLEGGVGDPELVG